MNPDYCRTTITVPFDLKDRMNKARARVNWSAVACDAFEKKLQQLGPIEEVTSIEAAILRMKAIKESSQSGDELKSNGNDAGKYWAMNQANPQQLQRIEDLRNHLSSNDWIDLLTSRDGFKELARCIEPHGGPHLGHRPPPKRRRPGRKGPPGRGPGRDPEEHFPGWERGFWRSMLDGRPDSPDFFLGFAEGALEIWKQVKGEL